jgi:hypothetical protein
MSISPFFRQLRSAYQAELDDLTFDSEGQDVLRQRLADRRKELGFLLQMIELSPEMVAVVFHQGFRFRLPAVMDHLLQSESDELPDWESLADAVHLTPWAQTLTQVILKEPMGTWFMSVAAALEYMHGKPETAPIPEHDEDDDEDDGDDNDHLNAFDAEEEKEARAREDAGADWMVEQGFDRKD